MILIVLTDCPPRLRGDLSKWLFEINTGVYVGRVSARVREALWNRICETLRQRQATMVYPAPGEQHMEFRVHNTTWEIVDYDGIKLMRRPLPGNLQKSDTEDKIPIHSPSKAAIYQQNRQIQRARQKTFGKTEFVVLDLETTGLSHLKDHIIEVAALRIRQEDITARFHALVRCPISLPGSVSALTGLTDEKLEREGRPLSEVLEECLKFIGTDLLVLHNAAFDYGFLQVGCKKVGLHSPRNQCLDTLKLARQKLNKLDSYSLEAVSTYFGLDTTGCHRAQKDCELTYGIYQKLKEI